MGNTTCGYCCRLVPNLCLQVRLQAETGAWRPWTSTRGDWDR